MPSPWRSVVSPDGTWAGSWRWQPLSGNVRFLRAGDAAWDVFDPEGRLLGSAAAPGREESVPPYVWSDRLYVMEADSLDVQYVNSYQVETDSPRQDRHMRNLRTGLPRLSLLAAVALLSAACGADAGAAASEWEGTMETLPNGAVRASNPEHGIWKPGEEWKLVEELRIGSMEVEGPELFGDIGALEVDPLGRIYVLDRQAKEVRVFGPDGKHVRTFGREGGGPGEFKDPIGFAWHPDGTLWVVDPGNVRYSVFDTAGTFLTSHRREIGGYSFPWNGGFDEKSRLNEVSFVRGSAGDFTSAVMRFDFAAGTADTILLPDYSAQSFRLEKGEGNRISRFNATVPFTPTMTRMLDARHGVWFGVTDRYRIYHQRLDGDTVRIVEREHTPVPVTAREREEAVERLEWFTAQGGKIDPSQIPSRKPAFGTLYVDDGGYLWVQRMKSEEEQGTVLDAFDPEGRYLGAMRPGLDISLGGETLVRGDRMYTVIKDELEVPYVVRYHIEGRGAGE